MVQLDALATGAQYRGGGLPPVLDAALAEARILYENGIGALMVQNLGDIPVALEATREQVAWMTRIASDIRAAFNLPVGLNMLENDAAAMMAVASASGADFVRIKIYVGAMMTPFGLETAKAHEAIKARATPWEPTTWRSSLMCMIAPARRWLRAVSSKMSSSPSDLAVRTAWC
jgi:uncharacterized protein